MKKFMICRLKGDDKMYIHYKTQGMSKPPEIEYNPYKVFIAKNIHFVEVDKTPREYGYIPQDYWEYDLYEYELNKYLPISLAEGEKTKADLTYIAMMTDVDLEEGEKDEQEI